MLKRIKMKNSEVEQLSNASQFDFPKYTTQIINLVNLIYNYLTICK